MSDPRSPRVRSAEETILDLHAKIESDAKVIAALREAEMADHLIPFTEQEVADLMEAIDFAIEASVHDSEWQRWAVLYRRLKSYND